MKSATNFLIVSLLGGCLIGSARASTVPNTTTERFIPSDSTIESRDGSDYAYRQYVWGTRYIDELMQSDQLNPIFSFPGNVFTGTYFYQYHHAMQDANYNVLGVVDESGGLIERYQYTPYGKRTVFHSPGADDVGCYAPGLNTAGICEIGHQGFMHDEEGGLVFNRARCIATNLGVFLQRDRSGSEAQDLYTQSLDAPNQLLEPLGNKGIFAGAGVQVEVAAKPQAPPDADGGAPQCQLELKCGSVALGFNHCDLIMTNVDGTVESGGGTGPGIPDGLGYSCCCKDKSGNQTSGPNPAGGSGYPGAIWGPGGDGTKFGGTSAGTKNVPQSTCDCIKAGYATYIKSGPPSANNGVYCALGSNSNSVTGMIMRCCGATLSGFNVGTAAGIDKNPQQVNGGKCSDYKIPGCKS